MTKEQKLESKYLTEVLNQLAGNFNDKSLIYCQKSFNKFAKDLKQDKIGLLRKGETLLRGIFI